MITKERVKEEIDRLPNDLVEEVYKFIEDTIKTKIKKKKFIRIN